MTRSTGRGTVRRHVAVCAFPFATHAAPLLLHVQRIAAAAPDVRFTFFNTKTSNAPLFSVTDGRAAPFHNIVPHTVHDGIPEGQVLSGPPVEAVGLFLRCAEENIRKSMAEAEEEVGLKISCLVTDAFLWFCQKIAEDKGAAWIPLWTGGPVSLAAHLHTDLFRRMIGDQGTEGREDEALDFLPGFSAVRSVDLPEGVVSGDINHPFSKMLHNMALTLPKATAVTINSFEELEPKITNNLKEHLKNLLNVGPFSLTSLPQTMKSDEYGCLSWVEGREPASVAYVSFGTITTPPPKEFESLAEALEESGVAFIWSMNAQAKAKLPRGFLERTEEKGKVVAWAPQLALLAHPSVGVFVTHGGWNSVSESMVSGVPMICRPFFGDQMLNKRFIETVWRIGTGVEGGIFTKSGTLDALEKVLQSEEGKQMRENLKGMKRLAEEAVKPDGSSTRNFSYLIKIVTQSEP
ncbi:hypothetical protein Ancab_017784 [Ancistrocladus abbreviatus]